MSELIKTLKMETGSLRILHSRSPLAEIGAETVDKGIVFNLGPEDPIETNWMRYRRMIMDKTNKQFLLK